MSSKHPPLSFGFEQGGDLSESNLEKGWSRDQPEGPEEPKGREAASWTAPLGRLAALGGEKPDLEG